MPRKFHTLKYGTNFKGFLRFNIWKPSFARKFKLYTTQPPLIFLAFLTFPLDRELEILVDNLNLFRELEILVDNLNMVRELEILVDNLNMVRELEILVDNLNLFRELEILVDNLNAGRPQCPVGLNTLVVPRKNSQNVATSENQPYVYLNCGHVQVSEATLYRGATRGEGHIFVTSS